MAPSSLSTNVELRLSCQGLKGGDIFSKADPFIRVHVGVVGNDNDKAVYTEIGCTEVQSNNIQPVFRQAIPVEFLFEVKQLLRFELYDCDDEMKLNQIEKHDKLGFVETTIPYLMGKRGIATLDIQIGSGKLTIKIVDLGSGETNEMANLQIKGDKLKKMDFFGKSDPYLKIFRILPSGDNSKLYETEVIKNTLSPEWQKCQLSVGHICGGSKSAKCIRIECWDWDGAGDHDSMGEVVVSFDQIIAGEGVELRRTDKPDKIYGVLSFRGTRTQRIPTFFDYIKGGVGLSLAVCIDFTASNNDPRQPDSLHFMNPTAPNHYVHAITAVTDVLQGYVTDENYAVFGFGARLPSENQPNHMFPLNFNIQNPYVHSVPEILNVYRHALTQVRLSGPTNFAPSIRSVTAASLQRPFTYTIQLIITDGEITDMQETMDALVAAAKAPLSIIIIGVGTACDFQQMSDLDADRNDLKAHDGTTTQRDLVQFVPMRSFASAPQQALAREVLREVPSQFLAWAKLTDFACPI